MLPNILLSEKPKRAPALFGFFILLLTFFAFFLDIATRDMIEFNIFYFPSIMLMTWYLGRRPGRFLAVLAAILWFYAQADVGFSVNMRTLLLDDAVHLFTFALVSWLTSMVYNKTVLLESISKELARSNLELEQFATKAAHDLQSPLATIKGFTELLKEKYEKTGDVETRDFTDHIIQSVKRMSAFIKALLNYANIKKPDASTSPVELEKVVKEVLGDFHFLISEKKAEITWDPLPSVAINPGLAGLLFQNLIGNAMKYCEKEPRVHISAVRKEKEWIFSIRDNGIGIPEESRELIFVMFEKLPTKRQYPGSGIGLASCQKIVERYGGRIWVESPPKDGSVRGGVAEKPEEGSTFFFTLPAG